MVFVKRDYKCHVKIVFLNHDNKGDLQMILKYLISFLKI